MSIFSRLSTFTNYSDCRICDRIQHLEAYASRIQHAVTQYPCRVSLEWRFLDPMESNAVCIAKILGVFSGWHTIAFEIDIKHNIGDAMVPF